MLYSKSSEYLYQMVTGENGVGSKQEGEREREGLINGVRDCWRDLEIVCIEMTIGERTPEYFKQIR
jgi:hypothetical protein